MAVPFLSVQFPPVADLPQQVAQARLFWEALADPGGPYRVQWLTPYGLAYVIMGAAWGLASPENADGSPSSPSGFCGSGPDICLPPRAGAPRPQPSWPRRSSSTTRSTGLLELHGRLALFAVWFLLTSGRRAHDAGWGAALGLLVASGALYFAHVLWLAVGTLWSS